MPWKTHGLGLEEPGGAEGKVRAEDLGRIWGGEEPNAALSQGFWHRETFPEEQTVGVGWGRDGDRASRALHSPVATTARARREGKEKPRLSPGVPRTSRQLPGPSGWLLRGCGRRANRATLLPWQQQVPGATGAGEARCHHFPEIREGAEGRLGAPRSRSRHLQPVANEYKRAPRAPPGGL